MDNQFYALPSESMVATLAQVTTDELIDRDMSSHVETYEDRRNCAADDKAKMQREDSLADKKYDDVRQWY